MNIWLDDYDSIKIVTKDGETVAEIKADGEGYFQRILPQDSED